MRTKLFALLEARHDEMVAIRRHLHQHPEVSFEEKETATYIENYYKGKPIRIDTQVGGGYGLLVTINEGKSDQVLALRADFDALPIHEATGLDFASEVDGKMHACGHDAHTAYLMVLADCLIELKDEIPGTIKIIHQHAEEVPPGGAKDFVNSGLLDDVTRIYGIHVAPIAEPGVLVYRSGLTMAGSGVFSLKITGKGGHGSSPHNSNDAIVAGAEFVVAAQTVVSRRVPPTEMAVVSVGHFDGVGQANVIKEQVELEATVRFFNKEIEQLVSKELLRIARGLGEMFAVEVEADYTPGYPPLVNDAAVTEEARRVLESHKGEYLFAIAESPVQTGPEDFASYLEKIPGSFFYVSSTPKGVSEPYFNHNPKFDVNEDALMVSAKAMADLTLDFFKI